MQVCVQFCVKKAGRTRSAIEKKNMSIKEIMKEISERNSKTEITVMLNENKEEKMEQ